VKERNGTSVRPPRSRRASAFTTLGLYVATAVTALWTFSLPYCIQYIDQHPPTVGIGIGGGSVGVYWSDEPMDMGFFAGSGLSVHRRRPIRLDGWLVPQASLTHWPRSIQVPLWPAAIAGLLPAAIRTAVQRSRRRSGLCEQCGFPASGRPAGPCPECGNLVTSQASLAQPVASMEQQL
jgi:hypothetical protein